VLSLRGDTILHKDCKYSWHLADVWQPNLSLYSQTRSGCVQAHFLQFNPGNVPESRGHR